VSGGPLDGIRVVELGVWVAGPACAGVMADWGADVVKVEPLVGDPMRGVFAAAAGAGADVPNPPFDLDNRGKRSMAVDLRTPEGRDAVERLLARADVFVTNVRPDALARLGLDHETLLARHERLVYASVTGYGLGGPDQDRAGYDGGAFWARGGVAWLHTPPGQPPPALRGGVGDHITGLSALSGVLAALVERGTTGRGRLVETSLLRTGAYVIGWDLGIQLAYGRLAPPDAREHRATPLFSCYQAGDGRWFWLLGLEADRHFPGLCAALGRDDLFADERFTRAKERRLNAPALIAEIDREVAKHPFDELVAIFDAHDVWWAPVQSPADVVADPQVEAAGALVTLPTGVRAVAPPAGFGEREVTTAPVPALGEHTEELLREVGFDDAGVTALREAGAIR
jgi:crotonobetainyl-CoA:carnitine CoA-transferase CaiB-like acyl-CoA transferase